MALVAALIASVVILTIILLVFIFGFFFFIKKKEDREGERLKNYFIVLDNNEKLKPFKRIFGVPSDRHTLYFIRNKGRNLPIPFLDTELEELPRNRDYPEISIGRGAVVLATKKAADFLLGRSMVDEEMLERAKQYPEIYLNLLKKKKEADYVQQTQQNKVLYFDAEKAKMDAIADSISRDYAMLPREKEVLDFVKGLKEVEGQKKEIQEVRNVP